MKTFAFLLMSGAIFGALVTVNTFSIFSMFDEFAPPKCPMPNGTSILLPNPDDCSTFYQCVGTDPILLPCLNGTWFNPNANVCDWPGNIPEGSCIPPTSTIEPETSAATKPESTTEVESNSTTGAVASTPEYTGTTWDGSTVY